MRAYLSDVHNMQGSDPNMPKYGFLDGGEVSVADFLGGVAEREARAILSETEPVQPHGHECSGYARLHREDHTAPAPCIEYLALAESLAAFVAG